MLSFPFFLPSRNLFAVRMLCPFSVFISCLKQKECELDFGARSVSAYTCFTVVVNDLLNKDSHTHTHTDVCADDRVTGPPPKRMEPLVLVRQEEAGPASLTGR